MPLTPEQRKQAAEIVASGEYAGEGYWRETVRALLSEREEMLAILRTLDTWMDGINEGCPVCGKDWSMDGDIHASGCRLAALVRGEPVPPSHCRLASLLRQP